MNYASHDKIDLRHVYAIQKCLKIHQLNIIQIIKTTKRACERYQILRKEGKEKKQQYGRKSLLSIEKNIKN